MSRGKSIDIEMINYTDSSNDDSNDDSNESSGDDSSNDGSNDTNVNTFEERVDSFLSLIDPLDLIVFRGGDFISDTISGLQKIKTGSGEISHVEMAITRRWCPYIGPMVTDGPDTDDTLLSWGSIMSGPLSDGVYNGETGGTTFGVQIRRLRDIIIEYMRNPRANIGLCKLNLNPIFIRNDETLDEYKLRTRLLKHNLCLSYDEFSGCTYDANFISLLAALFPSLRPLRNVTSGVLDKFTSINKWVFCSEFVATVYIRIGVIDDSTDGIIDGEVLDPRDIVPVDFLGYDADNMLLYAAGSNMPLLQKPIML